MTTEELKEEIDILVWEAMFWSKWLPYNKHSSNQKSIRAIVNAFQVAATAMQYSMSLVKPKPKPKFEKGGICHVDTPTHIGFDFNDKEPSKGVEVLIGQKESESSVSHECRKNGYTSIIPERDQC